MVVTGTAYLGLFPGTVLLYNVAAVGSAGLVMVLTVTAFAGLLLTLVAARTHDRRRLADARRSFEAAIALCGNEPERAHLAKRLAEL